jgi:hypothetical protein
VYLVPRGLQGSIKASVHDSGRCHVAFDRQYVAENADPGSRLHSDRFISAAEQPAQLTDGVALAAYLLFLRPTLKERDELDAARFVAVEAAPDGLATEIALLISHHGTSFDRWPSADSMATSLVGSLGLPSGATAWLVTRHVPEPELPVIRGRRTWFGEEAQGRYESADDLGMILSFNNGPAPITLVLTGLQRHRDPDTMNG